MAGLMSVADEMPEPTKGNGSIGIGCASIAKHTATKLDGLSDVQLLSFKGGRGRQGAWRLRDVERGRIAEGERGAKLIVPSRAVVLGLLACDVRPVAGGPDG